MTSVGYLGTGTKGRGEVTKSGVNALMVVEPDVGCYSLSSFLQRLVLVEPDFLFLDGPYQTLTPTVSFRVTQPRMQELHLEVPSESAERLRQEGRAVITGKLEAAPLDAVG